MLTPYIYDRKKQEYTKNKTGFGMMVNNIFHSMRSIEKICLSSYTITNGGDNIARHKISDIVLHSRLKDWIQGIEFFLKYPQTIKGRIQYLYYFVNKGYLCNIIKQFKPDIINIHGLGYVTKPFIEICEELHIPYVVTLHGLIGLDESVIANKWDKDFERDFLLKAYNNNIPVTVVSTGVKNRIQTEYLHAEATNITVITNGTKIPYKKEFLDNEDWDLRRKFNLSADCKICVAIGSVSERRNHAKLIDVVAQMSKSFLKKTAVFICGEDSNDAILEDKIRKLKLQNTVYILGYLQYETLDKILEQADLNIVTSKDEGYGLSIMEALSAGIPTVLFENIKICWKRIHGEEAIINADEKNNYVCAKLIERALLNDWDKNKIKKEVKEFPFEKIETIFLRKYIKRLGERGGGIPPLMKTRDYIYLCKRKGVRILVSVGNLSDNKNQIAAVRSMEYLSSKYILILLGREDDGGAIRKMIIRDKLYNKVILAGFCDDMNDFWKYADLNLFLSKNDGFGLPVIEGFMRGIPTLMNKSLDAAVDLNVDGAIRYVESLKPEVIAEEITGFFKDRPDRRKILNETKKYSLETMADNYLEVMRKQYEVAKEYSF